VSQDDYRLVSFKAEHLPEVIAFQKELYLLNYPDTLFDDLFYSWIRDLYLSTLEKRSPNTAFVLMQADKIIAFYSYQLSGGTEKCAYLLQFFVEENHRGKGLGRSMLSHYETQAKQCGSMQSQLHASAFNRFSVDFYMNSHYKKTSQKPDSNQSFLLVKNLQ
jgi:GNAT superfamily N-acetyltransferase